MCIVLLSGGTSAAPPVFSGMLLSLRTCSSCTDDVQRSSSSAHAKGGKDKEGGVSKPGSGAAGGATAGKRKGKGKEKLVRWFCFCLLM